jgi:UDP-N-acetyl-D-glucosamine/UDP-N-acetyl-D-galactosamine dehydrogenase
LVDSDSFELLINEPEENCYDAVIVAVLHRQYKELGIAGIREFSTGKLVIFDVKHIFNSQDVDGNL